uniref:hypothetical protein n=1 Tax=Blautia sp. TaxID=1955243 RepID=UPI004026142E
MKRLKLFFMAMVMLFAVQICTVSVTCETQAATTTATVKKKTGLYREKGKYYYYTKGRKIRNQWKTVKGKRYYFGPKYYALTYHNKIGSRIYVFDTAGRLLNGKTSRIVNMEILQRVGCAFRIEIFTMRIPGDVFTKTVLWRESGLTERGRL